MAYCTTAWRTQDVQPLFRTGGGFFTGHLRTFPDGDGGKAFPHETYVSVWDSKLGKWGKKGKRGKWQKSVTGDQ